MTFGEKLKIIRTSLGLSQQELADRLKTTKQAISRYENSEREPNLKTAKFFSEKLGIDITYLADDEIFFCVGDKIRQERETRGYSPSQLSALLGISESRLCSLEHGDVPPSLLEITRLCKIFCCDSDWLLGLGWQLNREVPALNQKEISAVLACRNAEESDSALVVLSFEESEIVYAYRRADLNSRNIVRLALGLNTLEACPSSPSQNTQTG